MPKRLLFTLKPLDNGQFFFGREKSPFREEYFLRSNLFPQQTTALGLLRHWILIKTNQIGKDKRGWATWIGPESFNATINQDLGIIQSLGAVQVHQQGTSSATSKNWYLCRRPIDLKFKTIPGLKVSYNNGTSASDEGFLFYNGDDALPQPYNGKQSNQFSQLKSWLTDFSGNWLSAMAEPDENIKKTTGLTRIMPQSGCFYQSVRDGIIKNYAGTAKDEGYFKTETHHLLPGFSFSFEAVLDKTDQMQNLTDAIEMRFGADGHRFRIEVKIDEDTVSNPGQGDVFILTSDAQVSNTIYQNCLAAIAEAQNFRNISTKTTDTRFDKRPVLKWYRQSGNTKTTDEFDAREAQVLLQRGSLLIAKPNLASTLENILKTTSPAFSRIGYNQFKRLHFHQINQPEI